MKILIAGAGKMGSFFCDLLSTDHDVAMIDSDPRRLLFTYGCRRLASVDEIDEFDPDMVINAVTLRYTREAFSALLPHLRPDAMLCDIASVKTGLPDYYASTGHPFVSTHPMFGPTFASLSHLSNENAIIITEGDQQGREFFRDLYTRLGLNIAYYTFEEHDATTAYSLSTPFLSTLAFAGAMKPQSAPGTTFKRHLDIARGLLSEDDYLLSEILFNPNTPSRLDSIQQSLDTLRSIIESRDAEAMKEFLDRARRNIRTDLSSR